MRKKNILDRLTELEIITNEKDEKINFLVSKNEKLCELLEKVTLTDSNTFESRTVIPSEHLSIQNKANLNAKHVILLVKAKNYYQHTMQIPAHHLSEHDVLNSVSANLLYQEQSLGLILVA